MSECYMCKKTAVSFEHVPPKCLFPKSKDLPANTNLRNELMTVPSCAIHNAEKSTEDQYFLHLITGCEGINDIGREHYRNQIRRQNRRNSSIISRFSIRAVEVGEKLGHKVEIDRLDTIVQHLGYALFFAHFERKFYGTLMWIPEFLLKVVYSGSTGKDGHLEEIEQSDMEFENIQHHGANPGVFSYQVLEQTARCKIRLHFYEGCRFLLIFS